MFGPNSSRMRPVPVPRSSSERNGLSASASLIAPSTASSVTCSLRMRSHCAACDAEIGLRRVGARAAHRGEPFAVAHHDRILRIEPRHQRAGKLGAAAGLGQPEERPGAFAEALDQAGLDQQLEMARDARLRLAQDVGEVGDGQLGLGHQRQDAQPRRLARRLEGGVEGVERQVGSRVIHGINPII